jgi:hypothetical protein
MPFNQVRNTKTYMLQVRRFVCAAILDLGSRHTVNRALSPKLNVNTKLTRLKMFQNRVARFLSNIHTYSQNQIKSGKIHSSFMFWLDNN